MADRNPTPRRSPAKLARPLQPATKREKVALAASNPAGRVYGYARVSTTMQADEGESLAVQQRTIEGYATMNGWTLTKVYVERGVSGSKPLDQRPEGSELLGTLKPGDTVITPKLDRMFRSAIDALGILEQMKAAGIALHMIDLGGDTTTNGVSKLVFTILSAVAEAERDRTRERIIEVKADQKKRGRFLGGTAPFGFRKGDDGELVPVPEQQAAIRKMLKLKAENYSLRDRGRDENRRVPDFACRCRQRAGSGREPKGRLIMTTKTTNTPPAWVFNKLLMTLDAIRSCAERAPNPRPDLVAQHGERACLNSSFAMLTMMAKDGIDTIEELTDCRLATAGPEHRYSPEMQAKFARDLARDKALIALWCWMRGDGRQGDAI
jgi:putative DNA-invertase from lambdoid prophage Rac